MTAFLNWKRKGAPDDAWEDEGVEITFDSDRELYIDSFFYKYGPSEEFRKLAKEIKSDYTMMGRNWSMSDEFTNRGPRRDFRASVLAMDMVKAYAERKKMCKITLSDASYSPRDCGIDDRWAKYLGGHDSAFYSSQGFTWVPLSDTKRKYNFRENRNNPFSKLGVALRQDHPSGGTWHEVLMNLNKKEKCTELKDEIKKFEEAFDLRPESESWFGKREFIMPFSEESISLCAGTSEKSDTGEESEESKSEVEEEVKYEDEAGEEEMKAMWMQYLQDRRDDEQRRKDKREMSDDEVKKQWFQFVKDGNIDGVRALADEWIDVNIMDSDLIDSALHYAAGRGNTEMVELLLRRGADKEAVDGIGKTALDYAVMFGRTDVAEILRNSA